MPPGNKNNPAGQRRAGIDNPRIAMSYFDTRVDALKKVVIERDVQGHVEAVNSRVPGGEIHPYTWVCQA